MSFKALNPSIQILYLTVKRFLESQVLPEWHNVVWQTSHKGFEFMDISICLS